NSYSKSSASSSSTTSKGGRRTLLDEIDEVFPRSALVNFFTTNRQRFYPGALLHCLEKVSPSLKSASSRPFPMRPDLKRRGGAPLRRNQMQKDALPLLMEIVRKLDQFAPAELLRTAQVAHCLNDFGLLKSLEPFLRSHIPGYGAK
ncbi:unnamed protein product, partial [Amoebophrya sp. A25]